MSSERVMQEICTVTALGENALTSISYAKVALQMAETQNGCRKIGLGYSGDNVQCHLWINTETYLANAEESVTKFFRYLKCCFLPEIVKVGTKSYSRKECLQAFSKDTAELSNLEILSTNISELLQILISLIGLLPGINVNELTSTDLRYLAAFYLGGAVYRNSMVTGKIFKDYCGPSKYPIGNYAKVLQVTAKKYSH